MTHIFRRADEIARGVTDAELRRSCAGGAITRVHRGSYAAADALAPLSDGDHHLVRARAALATATAPDAALSHASAALLHGIAVWDIPLDLVHVTRNRRSGGRRTTARQVHSLPYDPDEVTVVDGIQVTTVARTVADLACSVPLEQAVCVADSAARLHGVTGDQVTAILGRRPTRPGNARARRVARMMDPRSENVGESRSRVVLHESGFAVEPQVEIRCGPNLYRVDLLVNKRTVGEFDGRVKYGRLVPVGDAPSDVVWREKIREDALRDAGFEVVRWTWADLHRPEVIVDRVRRADNRAHGT